MSKARLIECVVDWLIPPANGAYYQQGELDEQERMAKAMAKLSCADLELLLACLHRVEAP